MRITYKPLLKSRADPGPQSTANLVQKIRRPQNQENPIADYFLAELAARCEAEKIQFFAEAELPFAAGIDDLDFCTVLPTCWTMPSMPAQR